MSDLSHPDCKNKNSTHYFMCHMTQKEFEERVPHEVKAPPFKFNLIRRLNNGEKIDDILEKDS